MLAQVGFKAAVVDLDAYGSPMKHYVALLENMQSDVTVFVTMTTTITRWGKSKWAFGGMDSETKRILGLKKLPIPPTLAAKANIFFGQNTLGIADRFGFNIGEAIEAQNIGNARYIGLRLLRNGSRPSASESTEGHPASTGGAKKE